jgi:hypothetical protein
VQNGASYFHYAVEDLPRFISALDYLAQKNDTVDRWHMHQIAAQPVSNHTNELLGIKDRVSGYIRAKRVLLPRSSPCGGSLGGERIPRLRAFIHTQLKIETNALALDLIVFKHTGCRSITNHEP